MSPFASKVWAFALSMAILLGARGTFAHEVGLSRAEYRETRAGLDVEMVLARREVVTMVPALDPDRDGVIDEKSLAVLRPELAKHFIRGIRVTLAGEACAGELTRAALSEEDGLSLRGSFRCSEGLPRETPFRVTLDFLDELAQGHRHVARLRAATGARDEILFGSNRTFELARSRGHEPDEARASILGFVRMGAEHVLVGYDHLLFLFALVLAGGKARSLVLVITAFTVAHSLSLGIAVFGFWVPPSGIVEPAIALSIGYVAVENIRKASPDGRWYIAFPFGLVHGFGFAGALREAELPRAELPAALLSFNVGVELGQLFALGVGLPLVLLLRRSSWFPRIAVPAVSALVLLVSLGWFFERLQG